MIFVLSSLTFTVHKLTRKILVFSFWAGEALKPKGSGGKDHASFLKRSGGETTQKESGSQ